MQNAAETAPRRAAVIFVFITVALDMIALGVIAPVFVPLIEGFMHNDVERAAAVVGAFGTVFALMQFFWAPFLGVLSDRFGRRPVIILSNLGMAVDYAVMAVAPNLFWLLAGRIVSGITSASATAAGAYISDVTPAEKRAGAFGMIGGAFGIGFVLGPALGGLCGQIDPRLPFWVAGAVPAQRRLRHLRPARIAFARAPCDALHVGEGKSARSAAVVAESSGAERGCGRDLPEHAGRDRDAVDVGALRHLSFRMGAGRDGSLARAHRHLLGRRAGCGRWSVREALRRTHRAVLGDRVRRDRFGDLRRGAERLGVLHRDSAAVPVGAGTGSGTSDDEPPRDAAGAG